jgi:hypothetical protein
LLFGAVLGDRLTKKLILVLRGAPSAVDLEPDALVSGIRRRFAQRPEQIGVEVGYEALAPSTTGLDRTAKISKRAYTWQSIGSKTGSQT